MLSWIQSDTSLTFSHFYILPAKNFKFCGLWEKCYLKKKYLYLYQRNTVNHGHTTSGCLARWWSVGTVASMNGRDTQSLFWLNWVRVRRFTQIMLLNIFFSETNVGILSKSQPDYPLCCQDHINSIIFSFDKHCSLFRGDVVWVQSRTEHIMSIQWCNRQPCSYCRD